MKYIDVYKEGVNILKDAKVLEAELDARLLLEYVCKTDRNTLYSHPETEVLDSDKEVFLNFISKRKDRIPLQYITNSQSFFGLDFYVNESVLIPRQDTETLIEEALKERNDGDRILDMCTGSGCILISMLNYSNNCQGVGVDISADAIEVANSNATTLLANKSDDTKYTFIQSNLFEEVTGIFDLILSNPPYIPSKVIETLEPEVKENEPILALDGKNDGLWFYEIIVEDAYEHLNPGGKIIFEIGHDQGEAVSKLLSDAGYKYIEVIKDYNGLDRVVKAARPII